MTSPTHRNGGVFLCVFTFIILKQKGLLIPDVADILQLLLIYPSSIFSSTLCDQDHNYHKIPNKNFIGKVVYVILHPTERFIRKWKNKKGKLYLFLDSFNAHHRSWQTHSELTVILLLLGFIGTKNMGLNQVEYSICILLYMGLFVGMMSHLLLDLLTPSGIKFFIGIVLNKILSVTRWRFRFPENIRIVPMVPYFVTGNGFEKQANALIKKLNVLACAYIVWLMVEPYIDANVKHSVWLMVQGWIEYVEDLLRNLMR